MIYPDFIATCECCGLDGRSCRAFDQCDGHGEDDQEYEQGLADDRKFEELRDGGFI